MLRGAARGGVTYEATAPAAAALQAEPGHRLDAALDAASDPAGLVLSGTTGAVSGGVANAPARAQARGLASIARGEEGGTANAKLARKAMAKAGEDGDTLYGHIGNDLPLEAAVSVLGKSNPNFVAKQFTKKLGGLTEETKPYYKAIDDAPDPRYANPKTAPKNGGITLGDVEKRLEAGRATALDEGHGIAAKMYDEALARLRGLYGKDGVIDPARKLSARAMQTYANEVGEGLIPIGAGDAKAFSLAQQAKRTLYHDVVGAIEDEGARVGVDVTKLKQLNRKISTFASVRDAYADRAARGAAGHTTAGNLALDAAIMTGLTANGGLTGLATGAAVAAGRRAGLPLARGLDFGLAKLVQASRAGAPAAKLGQMAIEMGISREVAQRIANGGLAGIAKPDDDEPYTVPE
jgi:hypothetical protein